MPLKHTLHQGNLLLAFNGPLTIFQAADRKSDLMHILTLVDRSLLLDMTGVEEIDTAGVQLLLLLKREVMRRGQQFQVVAYSGAVAAVLELLQLHAILAPANPLASGGARR